MSEQNRSGHYIRFVGWLREDGDFTLDVGWETPRRTEAIEGAREALVQLLDEDGQALVEAIPQIGDDNCEELGGRMNSQRVVGYVPFHPNARTLRLQVGGRIVCERTLSRTAPKVVWRYARVEGDHLHLGWFCEHDLPVVCDIAIVQGKRVARVVHNASANSAEIDLSLAPMDGECKAVVLATDRLRSSTAESEPFVLPEKSVRLTILSPAADLHVSEADGLTLLGHAMSPDGRSLGDEGLQWSVDGNSVATGKRLAWIPGLVPGRHTIALTWRDSAVSSRVDVIVGKESERDSEWSRAWNEHRRRRARDVTLDGPVVRFPKA